MITRHQRKTTTPTRSRAATAKPHRIQIRRVYADAQPGEGKRFLVDRLWPRGVSKKALGSVRWLPDVAPSPTLRKWFEHDPNKWKEFQKRYRLELKKNTEVWNPLLEAARLGNVTLLFAARDEEINHAAVLKKFLEKKRDG